MVANHWSNNAMVTIHRSSLHWTIGDFKCQENFFWHWAYYKGNHVDTAYPCCWSQTSGRGITEEIKGNQTSCCRGQGRQRCWRQRRSCQHCSQPRRCTRPGRTPPPPCWKLENQSARCPINETCILRCWPPLETVTLLEPVTNLILNQN